MSRATTLPAHERRSTARRRSPKRVLNVLPSRTVENDWTFENAAGAGIVRAPARLPGTVDLRAQWWKIADQGQTGSCVGWALADSVLRRIYVKAGHLSDRDLLSPRFIWMAAKETDEFIRSAAVPEIPAQVQARS
jgi:hypothetical protein